MDRVSKVWHLKNFIPIQKVFKTQKTNRITNVEYSTIKLHYYQTNFRGSLLFQI
jgi:hypothetical protein